MLDVLVNVTGVPKQAGADDVKAAIGAGNWVTVVFNVTEHEAPCAGVSNTLQRLLQLRVLPF
jgi:hypothetical protein